MKRIDGWYVPDDAMGELEWSLRYNSEGLGHTDFLHVASIIENYRQFIKLTARRRDDVVRRIRGEMLRDKLGLLASEKSPGTSKGTATDDSK